MGTVVNWIDSYFTSQLCESFDVLANMSFIETEVKLERKEVDIQGGP